MDNCTLSVLTWRTPKTLGNTLASLSPIKGLFKELHVVCQEGDPQEIAMSIQFGFTPIALAANLGIQEGLATCAEVASTELVLVMENDCLLSNSSVAASTLSECASAFEDNKVDVVKLGAMNWGLSSRYKRYWGQSLPPRATWQALLRPTVARSCSGQAVYHKDFPSEGMANISRISPHLYVIDSRYVGWTNRAFLVRREFFLKTVIAFARAHPARDTVNGKPDLEKEINSFWNRSWWRGKNFRVGVARPGLFGHVRLDRNASDEKVHEDD